MDRGVIDLFQSTRPVRGATSNRPTGTVEHALFQSTRPVRGATSVLVGCRPHLSCFNPRAPCGARLVFIRQDINGERVSIHAPRAGRDSGEGGDALMATFVSIHAPRAGRDMSVEDAGGAVIMFQSTRPVRGATLTAQASDSPRLVSIHAPRAGRDLVKL